MPNSHTPFAKAHTDFAAGGSIVTWFSNKYLRFVILILVFLFLRLNGINRPLIEMHNVRQTQTAMITRNLLQDKLNIFTTRIDWKGNEPGYFVQEFPLYNAIVVIFWKLFGIHDFWGRLVSLAFSAIAALYLYKIAVRLFSSSVAFWAVSFFAICPISVFMSQAFMINMCALALALAAVYHLLVWAEQKLMTMTQVILGSVFLTLSALTNITVTFIFLVPIGYILWVRRTKSSVYLLGLGFLVFMFSASNLAWNAHAAAVNAVYYPGYDVSFVLSHFFSTTQFNRLDPYLYFRMAMYFGYFVVGFHGLVLIFIGVRELWGKIYSSGAKFVLWLTIGAILYYVVFFNALVGHNYYTLPVVPLVALVIGLGVTRFIERNRNNSFFILIVMVFVLTYGIWLVFPFIHMHEQDTIAYEAAKATKSYTLPTDLAVVGVLHTDVAPGAMYPTILYYAERKGWNLFTASNSNLDYVELDGLIQRGADYLIFTYGQPNQKPISSLFPFFRYFGHSVDIPYQETLNDLKKRYELVEESKNYSLFHLTK